jgi:phosphatidylglycerophosphatase A
LSQGTGDGRDHRCHPLFLPPSTPSTVWLSRLSYLIGGFCLFRFFDILKPPPIRLVERKTKGGYGVVLDDVLAGIYAQISLRIIAALL